MDSPSDESGATASFGQSTNGEKSDATAVPPPRHRGPPVVILVPVLLACVLVPFLFWQGTWFGKPLSADEIVRRLVALRPTSLPAGTGTDIGKLRRAQHALEQISQRIQAREGRATAGHPAEPEQFYPHVLALVQHPAPVIRRTVAWLMQEDQREARFTEPLAALLRDADPSVRRNAALGLARRGDRRAVEVLREMLVPYRVPSTAAGTIAAILHAGTRVREGNEIARIDLGSGTATEIRAPLQGTILEALASRGQRVERGDPLVALEPSSQHVFYALVGLAVFGEPKDLPLVQPYLELDAHGRRVQQQARRTRQEILRRGK